MKKEVNVKVNTIYNIIKSISTIIFPLITFPYSSRILMAENIGKINFGNSIVSYISLIASLGVSTYAIRECAKVRDDEKELEKVSSQIFSINVCSTLTAYIILGFILLFVDKLHEYRVLILIQSTIVIFATLGTDWLNSAMEDFKYLTIRTFAFQFIALILMFIFVRDADDYYIYTIITVFATSGGNVLNIFYRKKFCKVKFTLDMGLEKHIVPIMLVFSMVLSQTIYCNSDMTILGIMRNDYEVGLYSVAVRIYTIVNTMVASVALVVMPQMSCHFASKNYDKINELLRYSFSCIVVIGFPVIVGIATIAPEIVEIIAGAQYKAAALALRILMLALFFSFFGGIVSNIILIPSGREKICLQTGIASACVNIVANFILIPYWGIYAAAFTTALAECVGFLIVSRKIEKEIKLNYLKDICFGPVVGCVLIVIIGVTIKQFAFNVWINTAIIITLSVVCYIVALIVTNNKFAMELIKTVRAKVLKR